MEINYIRVILFSMYIKIDTTQNECIFSINYSIVNFDLMQKNMYFQLMKIQRKNY